MWQTFLIHFLRRLPAILNPHANCGLLKKKTYKCSHVLLGGGVGGAVPVFLIEARDLVL